MTQIRLTNQLLSASRERTPSDIIKHLGAVQAQDYSGGEWSIGLRQPGSKLAHVEKEILEGKIVRTWALRGTLHFLAGADARWILELIAPGLIAGLARRYKELGLDQAMFRKTNSILASALKGNKHLTRGELKAIIEKNRISCEGQRMTFMLHRASLDRVICFGITRGKQQTHALFDEWVPEKRAMDREEALAELALRYFTSHGPATIQDYMWWSGLSAADARAGLEMVKSRLTKLGIGSKDLWGPVTKPFPEPTSRVVYLLTPFDDFLLGYKDRSASIDNTVSARLRTGGMPEATIILDGKVTGAWNRKLKRDGITIETRTFRKLNSKEEKALQSAVNRYAEFVGRKSEWRVQAPR